MVERINAGGSASASDADPVDAVSLFELDLGSISEDRVCAPALKVMAL